MRFSQRSKEPVNTIVVRDKAANKLKTFRTLDPVDKECLQEIMFYYIDTYHPTSVADLSVTVNGELLPPIPVC